MATQRQTEQQTKTPEATQRPNFGTTTEREPGTGRIVRVLADGRRIPVVDPNEGPLTTWPTDNPKQKAK